MNPFVTLLALLTALTATSNSHAQPTYTKIGNPAFDIDVVVMGSGNGATKSNELAQFAESVFGDWTVQGISGSSTPLAIVPFEVLDVPFDERVRREFAANGHVNTNVFAVEEVFWDRHVRTFIKISPTSDSPMGASPQSANGPIIPSEIYPLQHEGEFLQEGQVVWSGSRSRESLSDVGSHTLDDGTQVNLSELNFSDHLITTAFGANRNHSRDSLATNFEQRFTLIDVNGNGWEYTIPQEVVAYPTDIVGDLNYNGNFDVQDLDILTQNVVVAPAEPHGEFLRRLDLNGDNGVTENDRRFWVHDLAGTFFGDTNLDSKVDAADLNTLAVNWRQPVASWGGGDFTGDGVVDAADLNFLALNWQNAASEAAAVPEPSSALLLSVLCGSSFCLLRDRQKK